nr:9411_t:CDS:2 [Entrophospora candida]CAG8662692.1 8084_t:CDS:2 [Entrophospora candida]
MLKTNLIKISIIFIIGCYVNYFCSAEDIVIEVAPTTLKFSPQNVTAKVGDTITWKVIQGNHIIAESDVLAGCSKTKDIGSVSSNTLVGPQTFSYTVTKRNNNEIYYFCAYAQHCANGMWGVITISGSDTNGTSETNEPGETGSDNDKSNSDDDSTKSFLKANLKLIIGVLVGVILFSIIVLSVILCACRKRKARKVFKDEEESEENYNNSMYKRGINYDTHDIIEVDSKKKDILS